MATIDKDFLPLSPEIRDNIHILINASVLSVLHEEGAVIYKLCIAGDRYMEMARDFFVNENGQTDVLYTIMIYDADSVTETDIAHLTVSLNRQIFTPREQEIIDVFNACSKRIIQQEMQLIQNRIMNLTADYTHN